MTIYPAKRNPDRCPSHPGILIADLLEELRVTVSNAARTLGVSRQHLYALIAQKKPVTADVAVRLSKAFGDGAEIWLRMQARYDQWHAERMVDPRTVRRIKAKKAQ